MLKAIFTKIGVRQLAWAAAAGVAARLVVESYARQSPTVHIAPNEIPERHHRKGEAATAAHPADIPPRRWVDILKCTYTEIESDRVLAVAGGVAFFGLLAIFPTITALVSLYGLVADRMQIADLLMMLSPLLPASALEVLHDQIVRIVSGNEAKLGLALAGSLGLSLWSANAGMKAMFDALNVAYGERETRGFFALNAITLTFTLGAILFVLLAIAVIAVVPALLNYFYLGQWAEWIIWFGRWPMIFSVLVCGLALLYRFGPSRRPAKWRWVSVGAVLAALIWVGFSILFSWYVANFADYNKTYGALGAVIALLMWMWLSTAIVLAGAELNAETEQRVWRDTTVGPPKPVGTRGAYVADVKKL